MLFVEAASLRFGAGVRLPWPITTYCLPLPIICVRDSSNHVQDDIDIVGGHTQYPLIQFCSDKSRPVLKLCPSAVCEDKALVHRRPNFDVSRSEQVLKEYC